MRLAKRFFYAAGVLLLLPVQACRVSDPPEFQALGFTVNEAMLGEVWADSLHNVRFSPPAPWKPLERAALEQARSAVSAMYDDQYAVYDLKQFFMDPSAKHFCSYSLADFSGQGSSIDDIDAAASGFLHETFSGSEIIRGKVLINGIRALQYRIVSDSMIVYKLFLFHNTEDSVIQIDYALSRPVSGRLIEFVESSIGSISFNTKGERS